jgi:prolyl-tRNA synthetase
MARVGAPRGTRGSIAAVAKAVLTPQAQDFPRWYQDVIAKAQLAENGPVRGTMVIRPWAFEIWEHVQHALDERIKAAGVHNAYFPMLIPEEYMRREAEHVEGFSPELAVVTHGGGKALEQPVVLRPTSETIINSYFAKWISSYRDLPLKVNNWANVVRWELRPRIFLRTTEFLWQEGHTAHVSESEARAFALHVVTRIYEEVMRDVMAIPVFTGRKTERERFAGAVRSWTCEGVMRDGKALQMGTSHELGQGFSRAFGTLYTDRDGVQRHPWQTSWGASTRLLGALIMVHGDDRGLRLPPLVAPVQVAVVVIKDEGGAGERARALAGELADGGVRVEVDDRADVSLGRRLVDWDLKGVPVRLEIGPRDLAAGQATLFSRARDEKTSVALEEVVARATDALRADQDTLREQAAALRDGSTVVVAHAAQAAEAARAGFARLPWRELGEEGEQRLAEQGASVRCLLGPDGTFAEDVDAEGVDAIVARAY